MATRCSSITALSLLILLATQGNCEGEDNTTLQQDGSGFTCSAGVRGIDNILKCFGDSIKDKFNKLSEEISEVTDQICWRHENFEDRYSCRPKTPCPSTEEIEELKSKLERKEKTVDQLTELNINQKKEIAELREQIQHLKNQLEIKNIECEQNSLKETQLKIQLDLLKDSNEQYEIKIRDLTALIDSKTIENEKNELKVGHLTKLNIDLKNQIQTLNELVGNLQNILKLKEKEIEGYVSKEKEQNIQLDYKTKLIEENQLQIKNLTAELELKKNESDENAFKCIETPVNWTESCEHPKFAKIKEVITTFSNKRNWAAMKKDITPLLDPSSEVLKQLSAGTMWYVGYNGYTQLAAMFQCAGLPLDTADADGNTMLIGASKGNKLETVKLLIERGANVNVKDNVGWTPLMRACTSQLEIAKLLVAAGADINAKDNSGYTALQWAKYYSNTDVIAYLESLYQSQSIPLPQAAVVNTQNN